MLKGFLQTVDKRGRKKIQISKANGNRIINTDNYIKCKWIKCSNQDTQTGRTDIKKSPYICCLQDTQFRWGMYRLKGRGYKIIFFANGNENKAGVAILIKQNRL